MHSYRIHPGAAFIEVKRPGENLANHQQQLLEYCFQEGVKLAALTNGRTWWLYLPLQPGSWEQRRFLTIDLESQPSDIVGQWFIQYLSQENVSTGRAVRDAEGLVQSQQRTEIARRTIGEAWKGLLETPDEILVDLISETSERICGFKPEPELIKDFLKQRLQTERNTRDASDLPGPSQGINTSSGDRTLGAGPSPVLPITLEPPNPEAFLNELLLTKEAWIEENYTDGHKEIRHWDAARMSRSSGVINNLRSKTRYRQGTWQRNGLAWLRVCVQRPESED